MRRKPPYHPGPVALDPASGFKVPHRDLVKQWDGEFVDRRFVDKRNPQDTIRARPERHTIPNPRPEPADEYLSEVICTEDGIPIIGADGDPLRTEGAFNGAGL